MKKLSKRETDETVAAAVVGHYNTKAIQSNIQKENSAESACSSSIIIR
jgi:hypothetical protein